MKRCEFPVGNPKVYTRESIDLNSLPWKKPEHNPYKGLLLVSVLPPKSLYYPVLHYRTNAHQLTFPLCRECAETCNQMACDHLNSERKWIGCYTHSELNKALSLGYQVLDVFEVWHYRKWRKGDNGLFSGYMDMFLKQKASIFCCVIL